MAGINATKTETIKDEYRNGEEKTVSINDHIVTVFIGTIDNTKYPNDNRLPNYDKIVWTDKFCLTTDSGYEEGLSFEDAIEKYFEYHGGYKIVRQIRTLVDGTEDSCVIRYRL